MSPLGKVRVRQRKAYTANNLNQYTAITREAGASFTPAYDSDGNQTKIQTSMGEWEVSYNALNQAARFIQGTGGWSAATTI